MRLPSLFLIAAVSLSAAGAYSNRRAPGFSIMDSHFVQHDLQDYKGKVVLIDFMVTTCPMCKELADNLVKVQQKFGDKIEILSIVALPDNFDTASKFAADHKVNWPVLFDSGQVMMSYLKLVPPNRQVHFPHLFMIDASGTIRNDMEGTEDSLLTVPALSAQIEKLLK